MTDNFTEFANIVGTEVPVYRECQTCGELCIINPETYKLPKTECDPEGFCTYYVPICLCNDGDTIYSYEALDECPYPNCRCGNGKEK